MLRRLIASRLRISTQLYTAFGVLVAVVVVAGMVGWYSFDRVGEAQRHVNEGSVPALVAAFGVAQQSGALAAAAPRLAASATQLELTYTAISIEENQRAFNAQMTALAAAGAGGDQEQFERIRAQGKSLVSNLAGVQDLMWEQLSLQEQHGRIRARLASLSRELAGVLVPAIDDQLFYAVTGYRELDAAPAPRSEHFSEAEFRRYRHLAEMQADTVISFEIIGSAINVSDISLLEPLRERLEAADNRIAERFARLQPVELRHRLEPYFDRLRDLGTGPEGSINTRARQLELDERREQLFTQNQNVALELVRNVESLVGAARESAVAATSASEEAILTGRNLLLWLSAASAVGAALVSWLFVGRVIIRRLAWLSERMRQMADGDLEGEIMVRGQDEIADMSSALEVFRRHALEIQRLNLVEKLAEELRVKNEQVEATLAELQKAQDQIVMREKLAALGELTAGVAHEIRNPLNFVKNFAESSAELLEEMMEEVQTLIASEDNEKVEESQEVIQEINNDLIENVRLIQQHGGRADSIVQSMLMMGRGSGDYQSADINALVAEHTRLAYHSARATDPDFHLELVIEPDPDVGELEVIPQDLGRVFLNLAGNACYATDEKRRGIAAGQAESESSPGTDEAPRYNPELRVSTHSGEDGIEIRIRDNGNGIPASAIDKIFNPFFTTKPTDKGTGLGLSLSNDIIRQHGGSIEVKTEQGAYTEMIVRLPRQRATDVMVDSGTQGEA